MMFTIINKILKSKALKAGSCNTISNIIIRGVSYLTIPLFIRLMTKEEYGLYATILSYEAIFGCIIGLGINGLQQTAKYDFSDNIFSFLSFSFFSCIGSFLFLFFVFFICYSNGLQIKDISLMLLFLILLKSLAESINVIYVSKLNSNYQYKQNLLISIVSTIGNIGLSLVFICGKVFKDACYGRLYGGLITQGLICLVIFLFTLRESSSNYLISNFKRYSLYIIKLGFPLILHLLANGVLAGFDKIMIQSMVGAEYAAYYAFAYTFNAILLVLWSSIEPTLFAWNIEHLSKGNVSTIKHIAIIVLSSMILIGILIMSFAPEMVFIIGTKNYEQSIYSIPPLVFAVIEIVLYQFYVQIEYYKRETKVMAFATSLAAITNIVLNAIFIRKFGYIAATYTTVFSYFLMLVLHAFTARKMMNLKDIYNEKIMWLIFLFALLITCADLVLINFFIIRMLVLLLSIGILGSIIYKNIIKVNSFHV